MLPEYAPQTIFAASGLKRLLTRSVFSVVFVLVIVCNLFAQPKQSQATVQELYQQGESALRNRDLTQAEAAFRQVIVLDPKSAGAYSNLGVIAMRRQAWPKALSYFQKAAELAPDVAGVRLNIGLVYFKQGHYYRAISPLKRVVQSQPDSLQARYLLGLCYFFTEQYQPAIATLEPLWPRESSDMNYLYVLSAGADLAGNKDLEDRALARLVEVGQNQPEFHLLLGKAYLNHQDYDKALQEFQLAAQADPKLPFVHFNLGLALMNKQNFAAARDEFRKDIALEPDVASNYDQLGTAYSYLHQESEAEKCFREAIKRDSNLASPHFGLGKILRGQEKYPQALAELDIAEKLLPDDYHIRFVRGQVLMRLGRKQEAQEELKLSAKILDERIKQNPKADQMQPIPSPEVTSQ